MWPAIVGAVMALIAVISVLWYNARKAVVAESTAAAEKTAREQANRRTEALEYAKLREEAAARLKDSNEGLEIVSRGDVDAARDRLLRGFPGSKVRDPD